MNFGFYRWACGHTWKSALPLKEKSLPAVNEGNCPDCSLFISKNDPTKNIDYGVLGVPELI